MLLKLTDRELVCLGWDGKGTAAQHGAIPVGFDKRHTHLDCDDAAIQEIAMWAQTSAFGVDPPDMRTAKGLLRKLEKAGIEM